MDGIIDICEARGDYIFLIDLTDFVEVIIFIVTSMDLSAADLDCFNDVEATNKMSHDEDRLYCPHCEEMVHRSTFYRHKTEYLFDERSEAGSDHEGLFDGEFGDSSDLESRVPTVRADDMCYLTPEETNCNINVTTVTASNVESIDYEVDK